VLGAWAGLPSELALRVQIIHTAQDRPRRTGNATHNFTAIEHRVSTSRFRNEISSLTNCMIYP